MEVPSLLQSQIHQNIMFHHHNHNKRHNKHHHKRKNLEEPRITHSLHQPLLPFLLLRHLTLQTSCPTHLNSNKCQPPLQDSRVLFLHQSIISLSLIHLPHKEPVLSWIQLFPIAPHILHLFYLKKKTKQFKNLYQFDLTQNFRAKRTRYFVFLKHPKRSYFKQILFTLFIEKVCVSEKE